MTIDRRSVLELGLIGAAAGSIPLAGARIAAAQSSSKTYVLVHGAWHGGWCWREVAEGLRGMGHRVSTPTQTGLGERKHLLSKDVTLDTFAADIVNHIEAEELNDVILVGHSFGGTSITCTTDKIPNRIYGTAETTELAKSHRGITLTVRQGSATGGDCGYRRLRRFRFDLPLSGRERNCQTNPHQ